MSVKTPKNNRVIHHGGSDGVELDAIFATAKCACCAWPSCVVGL